MAGMLNLYVCTNREEVGIKHIIKDVIKHWLYFWILYNTVVLCDVFPLFFFNFACIAAIIVCAIFHINPLSIQNSSTPPQVRDPGLDPLPTTLESVQNHSACLILSDYHCTASVSSMNLSLNLPLLSLRRTLSPLCEINYFTKFIIPTRILNTHSFPHFSLICAY